MVMKEAIVAHMIRPFELNFTNFLLYNGTKIMTVVEKRKDWIVPAPPT
nr:hypothetical protein [Paenibacillus sp. J23TS9]